MKKRKTFTTTIDEQLQKDFKKSCIDQDEKMNDVLEAFMNAWITGQYTIEKNLKSEK
ncbi:hypothetical protein [Paenibacillus sp. CFBP13512]|uniref:hypothetical protein n=1 Tax=Paenibacillus sp. CFBP13512 TaxID=2184007 RepID=UPI001375A231|nr:hypothetical protein [Paenibacillus sp. CFBP13512]